MMSQKYNQESPECGNLYRTNKLAFSTIQTNKQTKQTESCKKRKEGKFGG